MSQAPGMFSHKVIIYSVFISTCTSSERIVDWANLLIRNYLEYHTSVSYFSLHTRPVITEWSPNTVTLLFVNMRVGCFDWATAHQQNAVLFCYSFNDRNTLYSLTNNFSPSACSLIN